MDLMLGCQLGHRFLFLQNFEDNLDLQFDGIALSKRAHHVLKTPLIFCLNFPIYYTLPSCPVTGVAVGEQLPALDPVTQPSFIQSDSQLEKSLFRTATYKWNRYRV